MLNFNAFRMKKLFWTYVILVVMGVSARASADVSVSVTQSSVNQCDQDTYTITVSNPSGATSNLTEMSVSLDFNTASSDFEFVDDSASINATPAGFGIISGVSANPSVVGDVATWNLDNIFGGDVELEPNEAIVIGLTVDYGCDAATDVSTVTLSGQRPRGVPIAAENDVQNVTVLAGDVALKVNPSVQAITVETLPDDNNASWTFNVENSGLGNIYNVAVVATFGAGLDYVPSSAEINGNALNPSDVTANQIIWDMNQLASDPDGAGGLDDLDGDGFYDDLEAGESFDIDNVLAQVISCADLTVTMDARFGCNNGDICKDTSLSGDSVLGSLAINIVNPDVSYVFDAGNLIQPVEYCTGEDNVTLMIQNGAGAGQARDMSFLIDQIPSADYTISVVSPPGVTYDSNTGIFSNIGHIDGGDSVNVVFDIDWTGNCSSPGGNGNLLLLPSYQDVCGVNFAPPATIDAVSLSDRERLEMTLSNTSVGSVDIGDTGINLNVNVSVSGFAENPGVSEAVDITYTVAPGWTIVDPDGGMVAGNVITWSHTFQLTPGIDAGPTFSKVVVVDAPADPCEAGTIDSHVLFVPTININDCQACAYDIGNDSESATIFLNDDTATVDPLDDSDKSVSYAGTQGGLEGEACRTVNQYTVTYDFSTNAPGAWAGLVFTEFLELNQSFVSLDSVTVNGGTNQAGILSVTDNSPASFSFMLDPLDGVEPVPSSGGTLVVRFSTSTTAASEGSAVQFSHLTIPGSDSGCAVDPDYEEGVNVSIGSQGMGSTPVSISASLPMEHCGVKTFTVNVQKEAEHFAYDPRVIVELDPDGDLTPNYGYIPGSTVFSSPFVDDTSSVVGVFEPVVSGTQLTWDFSGQGSGDYQQVGSIQISLRMSCDELSGDADDDAVSAQVEWNTYCDDDAPVPQESASNSFNPSTILILSPDLSVYKTPENLFIDNEQEQWTLYVTNSGAGDAYNVKMEDTLGSGVSYVSGSITEDSVVGPLVTWTFQVGADPDGIGVGLDDLDGDGFYDDLAPGKTASVVMTVEFTACSDLDDTLQAFAGCDTAPGSLLTEQPASYCEISATDTATSTVAPTSGLATASFAGDIPLCGQQTVNFIYKNTGQGEVFDVHVEQTLPDDGVDFVIGDTEYDVDADGNGSYELTNQTPLNDPPNQGSGTSGDPYIWDDDEIPQLAQLVPNAAIRIRYSVGANSCVGSDPLTFQSSADWLTSCGASNTSSSSQGTLTLDNMNVDILKEARNFTTGGAFTSGDVYGVQGDVIEYRITLTSNGDIDAQNVVLTDVMADDAVNIASLTPISNPPDSGDGSSGNPLTWGPSTIGAADGTPDSVFEMGNTFVAVYRVTIDACVNDINNAEASFGCNSSPSCIIDTNATSHSLVVLPDFINIQQVENEATACVLEKTVTFENDGARADNIVLKDLLPDGFRLDSFDISGSFSGTNLTASSAGVTETVDFSGTRDQIEIDLDAALAGSSVSDAIDSDGNANISDMDHGETVTLVIRGLVDGAGSLDNAANPADSNFNDTEATALADSPDTFTIEYESSCSASLATSADSLTITPLSPDLDISIGFNTSQNDNQEIFSDDQTKAIRIQLQTTGGEVGSAVHENDLMVNVFFGSGWENILLTGSSGSGSGTAAIASQTTTTYLGQTGTLVAFTINFADNYFNRGDAQIISLNVTADKDNAPDNLLNIIGEVTGYCRDHSGASRTPLEVYSPAPLDTNAASEAFSDYDQEEIHAIGANITKTLVSGSDSNADTVLPDVTIGETFSYEALVQLFGAESVTDVGLADDLVNPPLGPSGQHLEVVTGSVVNAPTATHNYDTLVSTNPLDVDWTTDIALAGGNAILGVRYNARVLNNANTDNGDAPQNRAGFAISADGVSDSGSANQTVNIREPILDIQKVIDGGETASGDAGNTFDVTLTVSHTGLSAANAFDVILEDLIADAGSPLTGKFTIVDPATDTLDNDNDGTTDGLDVGNDEAAIVTGGDIYVDKNTANATLSALFTRFQTTDADIVVRFRLLAENAVNPGESFVNTASLTWSSMSGNLDGDDNNDGTQDERNGDDDTNAANDYSDGDTAQINIDDKSVTKAVFTTSVGADASSDVLVGELVTFEVSVEIPEGTIPSFDIVDTYTSPGYSFDSYVSISTGLATVDDDPPVITDNPGALTLDFGTLTNLPGNGDQTIVVRYVMRVDNVSANQGGTVLSNQAECDGTTSSTVNLTVREPVLTASKVNLDGDGLVQDGDVVVYEITVPNATAYVAYDPVVSDTLDAGATIDAAFNADGLDNDGDGSSDEGDEAAQISVVGQAITFRPTGDIAASSSTIFRYRATVDVDVLPNQVIDNTAEVYWSSLPGVLDGDGTGDVSERTGSDGFGAGLNNWNTDTTASLVTVLGVSVAKTPDVIREQHIGDVISYAFTVDLPGSTTPVTNVTDTVPSGFVVTDVVVNGLNGTSASTTFNPLTDIPAPNDGTTSTVLVIPVTGSGPGGAVVGNVVGTSDFEVIVTGYPANISANQDDANATSEEIADNNATLNYVDASGATFLSDSSQGVSILEATLTASKTNSDGDGLVQAGDVVDYAVLVTNTSANTAFDVVLSDVIDVGATVVSSFTTDGLDNDGDASVDEPDEGTQISVTGQTITFRLIDDIAGSGSVTLRYRVSIDADVAPNQLITNTAEVFWSSLSGGLDGDGAGTLNERTGSDGFGAFLNNYNSDATVSSVSVPDLTINKIPDVTQALGIGDEFDYTVTVDLPEGETLVSDITDTIPSGLIVVNVAVNGLNATTASTTFNPLTDIPGPNDGSVATALFIPVQGSGTGGAVAGNDLGINDFEVVITVRVANVSANADDSNPVSEEIADNTATINYNDAAGAASKDDSAEGVSVKEAVLEIAKFAENHGPSDNPSYMPGTPDPVFGNDDVAHFVLTVYHAGSSHDAAYDWQAKDFLPGFMNPSTVSLISVVHSGQGDITATTTLTQGGSGNRLLTISPSTGSGAENLSLGESVTIEYSVQVQGASIGDADENLAHVAWSSHPDGTPGADDPDERTGDFVDGDANGVLNGSESLDSLDDLMAASSADLEIQRSIVVTKSDDQAAYVPGGQINYTVTVTNNTNGTFTGVNFDDAVPDETTFVGGSLTASAGTPSAPAGGSGPGSPISVAIGSMAPGASVTIQYAVLIDDPVSPGTILIHNQAQVSATELAINELSDDPVDQCGLHSTAGALCASADGGNDPDDDTDDDPTISPLTSAPEIIAEKTVAFAPGGDLDSDGNYDPGERVRYTIVFTNNGDIDLDMITLTDAPDADTTLVVGSVVTSQGIITTGNGVGDSSVAVDIGQINGSGATATVTFDADIGFPLTAANINPIRNQGAYTVDINGDNDVDDVVSGLDEDNLLTDDPGVSGDGQETGNNGSDDTDDDPTDFDIVSDVDILFLKSVVDDNGGSVEPGDVLTYTMTLSNLGDSVATNSVVIDAIPANTAYVTGSTTLNGSPVADVSGQSALNAGLAVQTPGAAAGTILVSPSIPGNVLTTDDPVEITFQVTVAANVLSGTRITNQGLVTYDEETGTRYSDDPSVDGDGNSDPEDETDPTVVVVGNDPVLEVLKTVEDINGGFLAVGETVHYTIIINNIGNEDATGVVFTDLLTDPNFALTDGTVTTTQGTVTTGNGGGDVTVAVDIGVLIPGGQVTIEFDAVITGGSDGTVISNQGTVGSNEIPDEPSDEDGNDTNGDQPTTITIGAKPLLNLVKSVSDVNGGTIQPGDILHYQITVTNDGAAVASGVILDDTPDADVILQNGTVNTDQGAVMTGNGGGDTAINVDIGDIAVGSQVLVSYDVEVGAALPDGTGLDNTAEADDTGDVSTLPVDDSVSVSVGGAQGSGAVCGTVYLDSNFSDSPDSGEGLQSWTVQVESCNTGATFSATTNGSGQYCVNGLPTDESYRINFYDENATFYGQEPSGCRTISSGTLQVDQNLPIDPSGFVYDSITGDPIEGVTVELIDVTGGHGGGPNALVPNIDLVGSNTVITGPTGFYSFAFVGGAIPPAGNTYEIRVTPPTGYLISGSYPPVTNDVTAGLLDIVGGEIDAPGGGSGDVDDEATAPFNGAGAFGAQYRYAFLVTYGPGETGEVFLNNIPLDPILDDATLLSKAANKSTVKVGEFVMYTLTITNNLAALLPDLVITDQPPAGFKYVEGSARLDGVPIDPLLSGTSLLFQDIDLSANQTREIKYLMIPGSGVTFGEYTNTAYATRSGFPASNTTEAHVRVIPDPVFDLTTIIGKVFWDKNANGIQDDELAEPGIAGAKIISVRGDIITTDKYGRYHLEDADPGPYLRGRNFILKVDPRSLGPNAVFTTENPRVVRISAGVMRKVNFGITYDASYVPLGAEEQGLFRRLLGRKQAYSAVGPDGSENIEHYGLGPLTGEARGIFDDLMMVGLFDLTVGGYDVSGNPAVLGQDDHYDGNTHVDGRIAFFMKGTLNTKYTLTAQMDTDEEEIDRLFHNLDQKDPRRLFRNLDEDDYYLTYGDGSTQVSDVDSQGKMYMRLDWDRSRVLLGNYHTQFMDTELTQYNRSLFGAKVHLESTKTTEFGDSRAMVKAFVAEAQHKQDHNEFLSTGSSLYYLQHQYVVEGSEKAYVEIRDPDSHRVVSTAVLTAGIDYSVDYSQGRILLNSPLSQLVASSSIISNNVNGGEVFLIVDYEYEADFEEIATATGGVRAFGWLTGHFGVGATAVHESRDDKNYELYGFDSMVKWMNGITTEIEVSQTRQTQMPGVFSYDGGLTFTNLETTSEASVGGGAFRIEQTLDLRKLTSRDIPVNISFYNVYKEEGFSSNGRDAEYDTNEYGVEALYEINDTNSLSLKHALMDEDRDYQEQTTSLQWNSQRTDSTKITTELRHKKADEGENNIQPIHAEDDGIVGKQEDVIAALKVIHQYNARIQVYAAQQVTLDHKDNAPANNRTTVGTNFKINDQWSMLLEGSGGNLGTSVKTGAHYKPDKDKDSYMELEQADGKLTGEKTVTTFGSLYAINARTKVRSERKFKEGRDEESVSDVHGIDYQLSRGWSVGLDYETSRVTRDNSTSYTGHDVIRRDTPALELSFKDEMIFFNSRFEARLDRGSERRYQYVTRNDFKLVRDEEWTYLLKLDYAITENETTGLDDARYAEAGFGLAYRPIAIDELNLLFKYSYVLDLEPLSQVEADDFEERAHVFSLDVIYELNTNFDLGGKAAWKSSEARIGRGSGTWFDSQTYLLAGRIDYHVIHNWDAMAEYRFLRVTEADDWRQGTVLGVYRHINTHSKVGVGYSFADFNDDLTNLDYDAEGWFLNFVGSW